MLSQIILSVHYIVVPASGTVPCFRRGRNNKTCKENYNKSAAPRINHAMLALGEKHSFLLPMGVDAFDVEILGNICSSHRKPQDCRWTIRTLLVNIINNNNKNNLVC